MKRLLLCALCLPGAVHAAMSGDEFDAYVTGKTLTYSDGGEVYGIEEYLPDQRVRWAFVGGQCVDGVWYQTNDKICFVYENRPSDRECWVFKLEGDRLTALFAAEDGERILYETEKSSEPLTCPGPDVGV